MAKEKKFYETDKFLKEKKKWDKILKDSGFEDIEANDFKDGRIRPQEFEVDMERVVYHQKCLAVLAKDQFKDDVDRFIFKMHCEGVTNRKIASLLEPRGLKPLKHSAVDYRLLAILKANNIKPITFNF